MEQKDNGTVFALLFSYEAPIFREQKDNGTVFALPFSYEAPIFREFIPFITQTTDFEQTEIYRNSTDNPTA